MGSVSKNVFQRFPTHESQASKKTTIESILGASEGRPAAPEWQAAHSSPEAHLTSH